MNKVIKKVGILTHRGNYNYGGLLQALAMQRWLQAEGVDAELINLNKFNLSGSRFFQLIRPLLEPNKAIKKLLKGHKGRDNSQLPPDNFKQLFLNYKEKVGMKYSEEVIRSNFGHVANQYDAIIIGSDQVWAYKDARPLIFFGQWKPRYTGKLISYAACNPNNDTPWYNKNTISRLLNHFDAISVRDNTTKQWVDRMCNRKASEVTDPTLLYNLDEFTLPDIIGEPYIFTYCLGSEIPGGNKSALKEIKKKYGNIKIIATAIPNTQKNVEEYADVVIYDATPDKWMTLIKYASFVYTDSFHGTLFSIKYQKQFIAYYTSKIRSSRLVDVKERYCLDSAIVSSIDEMIGKNSVNTPIDYHKTNKLVKEHIDYSISFLKKTLNI